MPPAVHSRSTDGDTRKSAWAVFRSDVGPNVGYYLIARNLSLAFYALVLAVILRLLPFAGAMVVGVVFSVAFFIAADRLLSWASQHP